MKLHHQRLIRTATFSAVCIASLLVTAKMAAWQVTHSISMQASLIDSILDALASLINFIAVRHALRPADDEHRFGHGKVEALASLAQSVFIAISAIWLITQAFHRFVDPQPIFYSFIGMGVMIFAIIATLFLVIFQNYVVRTTKSLVVAVDSLHYRTDLMTNIAVLLGLCFTTFEHMLWIDPLVGLVIAAYILRSSWFIGAKAVDVLMDREVSDQVRKEIVAISLNHPLVAGVHDLRTRSSGHRYFIQLHLDLPGTLSFQEAHDIAQLISNQISEALDHAEVIIHTDPISS